VQVMVQRRLLVEGLPDPVYTRRVRVVRDINSPHLTDTRNPKAPTFKMTKF